MVQTEPPKKKRKKWPIVLIIRAVVILLGIGGCVAIVNSFSKSVATGVQQQQDRNAPREVKAGEAFTVGDHETQAGWKVVNDGGMFSVTGKVKNVSQSTSTAFQHFKMLSGSGEVLGDVECSSSDLEPDQTQAMSCTPTESTASTARSRPRQRSKHGPQAAV